MPDEMTDAALETQLYTLVGTKQGHRCQAGGARLGDDPSRTQAQARHAVDPVGRVHRAPSRQLSLFPVLRTLPRLGEQALGHDASKTHAGGDKLFVDYAGDTVPVIIDRLTGATRPEQIFVAVLGASNFTYAKATWTQGLGNWIAAHTRAFAAIGGVLQLIVPDNAKVAVIKACLYEPQVNRTYAEMAAHYGTAVLPARPRRPRDKAKVEAGVLIVERWLIGRLRHRRFHSLAELNTAIGELLIRLNEERSIRRLGVTRRQLLEELDRPALKSLPVEPYVFAEWRVRRVGIDYHVDVDDHFYSVPYRFARAEVEVRLTARTVEVFARGERIAAHLRSSGNSKHTTIPDHMPSTGPSTASAGTPRTSGRRLPRCAISSWSDGPIPSRDSEPASASCASPDRSASIVSKPPPPAPSRSARSPTDRSAPSSTTSSIVTLRTSAPQTACRSSIPTFAVRATINRRPRLAHPSNPRPLA